MISEMMKSSIPSSWRLDARGAVGLGRPVVLVVVAGVRRATAQRLPSGAPPSARGLDVLDRLVRRARDALDELVGDPLASVPSGSVEMTISEMWKYCDGVHRSPCRGPGRRSCRRPRSRRRAQRLEQLPAAARAPRATARPVAESCGTTTMKRCGPSSASCLQALEQLAGRRPSGWPATSVTSNGRPSPIEVDHDVLDRQAGLLSRRSIRSRRSQPEDSRGQRRDDDLVDAVARRPRPSRR